MKAIIWLVMATWFIAGCGGDRSQDNTENLNTTGTTEISWIYQTTRGQVMLENNFVYIPGGFDVDDDGVEEGGFWLSVYEASKDSNQSMGVDPLSQTTNISTFLQSTFSVYDDITTFFDKTLPSDAFLTIGADEIANLNVYKVVFTENNDSLHSISPLEAAISLQYSQIENGNKIGLPSEKQWMQIVKLVINNPKNWTGGEVGSGKLYQGNKYVSSDRRSFVIENSILAVDQYVPEDYSVEVYDLSGNLSEWTSGMVAIEDRFLTGDSGRTEYSELNSAPFWWKPVLDGDFDPLWSSQGAGQYHDGFARAGANDTLEVSSAGTGDVDAYAVVARGGSNSIDDELLVGISAAKLTYGPGYKGPTVGFRAASGYLY